jgi:hypothetical protein
MQIPIIIKFYNIKNKTIFSKQIRLPDQQQSKQIQLEVPIQSSSIQGSESIWFHDKIVRSNLYLRVF